MSTTPLPDLPDVLFTAAATLRKAHADLVALRDIRGPLPLDQWAHLFGPDDITNLAEVNAWVRAVPPALAEPLAAWLHRSGEELSVATMHARDHGCDPVDLLDEPDSVRHALAVARAINQGGTE